MVVNPAISNVDVFSIIMEDDHAYVNFLKVINGAIIQGHTIEMKRKLDEPPEELNHGQEPNAIPKPHPHPTPEEAQQEIEAEDRFEATDN